MVVRSLGFASLVSEFLISRLPGDFIGSADIQVSAPPGCLLVGRLIHFLQLHILKLVLCVKLLLARPAFHNSVLVRVLGAPSPKELSANAPWKSAEDGPSACAPVLM